MPDIASKLFPNVTTIIIQLLSTGVLLLVFKKYLWVPVQNYFAKRAEFIEGTVNEAKDMNEKARKLMEESEEQARQAAVQYREIVNLAKEDALKTKATIQEQANQEYKAKLDQARREIEAEKVQAKAAMKQEIVEVAIDVASKVMNKEMDTKTNKALVEDFVEEVVN
ncbi:F0F1 ATP synthase subunit B [Thomasclavelia cocleata]|jgi:F-type H+-transporting ATPase subunit b|uniref:F0F1 ATP synthase subunit B n=1 Tax=Thomasclavelia cocleata TaxID=69824 RepID=UPI00242BD7A1|nr:F0F1 ATP synthase subunit B [Thomasclavelia cocleata]